MNESASAPASTPTDAAKKPLKLPDLSIEGFRGLERFQFPKLARVNLLVGPNNSGKTTVLEAVEILAQSSVWTLKSRRGSAADLSGLFNRSKTMSSILIQGGEYLSRFEQLLVIMSGVPSLLRIKPTIEPETGDEAEAEAGQLRPVHSSQLAQSDSPGPRFPVQFRTTRAADTFLKALWEQVVLQPEEEVAYQALRLIQPEIQRVAFLEHEPIVRLANEDRPRPLSEQGEGILHLLGLSLNLACARDGVLLVDEIDTGLYYRTLPNVWKLVIETARQLNVQVFATTHSRDCVEALANLDLEPDFDGSDLLVHRIDPGASKAVTYNLERLVRAVSHDIEVR